jgi:hypothetical protein
VPRPASSRNDSRGSPPDIISEDFAVRILILASILALTAACSGGGDFDRKVNSADEHYMSRLAAGLDAAGVDFRVARDGSIAYRSGDENQFRAIDERVKKDIAADASGKSAK